MSAEQGGTTGPEKMNGLALVDAGKNSGEVDEAFKRSMASLSRQLVAARSGEGALSISTGSGSRLVDFDREERISRRPSLKLALAFALGVAASSAGIYAYQAVNKPVPAASPSPPIAVTAAPASPSPPSAMPAISLPPSPPQPTATIDPAPAVQPPPAPATPTVAAASVPAPSMPAPAAPIPATRTPDQTALSAAEVFELQKRLEALGMSPGFLDGIPGPRTAAAVRRYEEARGQPPTGNLDRELLTRLRQDQN